MVHTNLGPNTTDVQKENIMDNLHQTKTIALTHRTVTKPNHFNDNISITSHFTPDARKATGTDELPLAASPTSQGNTSKSDEHVASSALNDGVADSNEKAASSALDNGAADSNEKAPSSALDNGTADPNEHGASSALNGGAVDSNEKAPSSALDDSVADPDEIDPSSALTTADMEALWATHQSVVYYSLAKLGVYKTHSEFEDWIQDGFIKLCELVHYFRGDWLNKDRYRFIALAKLSLRRFYVDKFHYVNQRKDDKADPTALDFLADDSSSSFEESLFVGECLKRLPEEDRPLFLALYRGDDQKQVIAQKFGISRRTLYRRMNAMQVALKDLVD